MFNMGVFLKRWKKTKYNPILLRNFHHKLRNVLFDLDILLGTSAGLHSEVGSESNCDSRGH